MFTETIRADLYRYTGYNNPRSFFKALTGHPAALFIFLFRKCNTTNSYSPLGLFYRICYKIVVSHNGVEIPHKCKIGEGLYMGHFKSIIINQHSEIGRNCNISQGVTIGRESRGKREGSPLIGDRVLIGPNSVVVGKISIGNDVLIGPLTFVNFDVPNNSVVLGNPAKIISDKGSKGYIKRTL